MKVDKDSKVIVDYTVTDASVHDSQELENLVDRKKDKSLYADSAYKGEEIEKCLGNNMENNIIEKGYRNNPLTGEQIEKNRAKSKIRCRIEHVFGHMTNSFKGISIRSIGIKRAAFNIGLLNLTYNVCRYKFLEAHAWRAKYVHFPFREEKPEQLILEMATKVISKIIKCRFSSVVIWNQGFTEKNAVFRGAL